VPEVVHKYRNSLKINYIAPEIFRIIDHRRASIPCDIWSFGCLVKELISGVLPWEGSSIEDIQ